MGMSVAAGRKAGRRRRGEPRYGAMMRRVVADGLVNPQAYRHTRDRLIGPHLRAMHATLCRGVEEGLIRPDVDPAWVRQLLTSPITSAVLALREPVTRAQVDMIVDTVLRGIRPSAQ